MGWTPIEESAQQDSRKSTRARKKDGYIRSLPAADYFFGMMGMMGMMNDVTLGCALLGGVGLLKWPLWLDAVDITACRVSSRVYQPGWAGRTPEQSTR